MLYKVGATRYSRVMGMLTLRDTKIMKFAFTAIGVASLLYGLAAAAGVAEAWGVVPRVMPYMGAAHLLGGALFGIRAWASPASVRAPAWPRPAVGEDSKKFVGTAAIVGLLAGVLLYGVIEDSLLQAEVIATNQKPLTLHGVLGLPYAAVALAWGALFVVIAIAVDRLNEGEDLQPARPRSGLARRGSRRVELDGRGTIAGLLVFLASSQGGYLGFSGALLAVTGWGAHVIGHPLEAVPRINDDIVWRAALILGVFPGPSSPPRSGIRSSAAADGRPCPRSSTARAIGRSFGAATVMSLGALVGGGCTTGAFIAAWPTPSLGSLAMAGTFFVVSMAVANGRLLAVPSISAPRRPRATDVYD